MKFFKYEYTIDTATFDTQTILCTCRLRTNILFNIRVFSGNKYVGSYTCGGTSAYIKHCDKLSFNEIEAEILAAIKKKFFKLK